MRNEGRELKSLVFPLKKIFIRSAKKGRSSSDWSVKAELLRK